MSPQPSPAGTDTDTNSTPGPIPGGDHDHHRRVLRELIDIGLDLARLIQAQAHAQPPAEPGPEPTSAPALPAPPPPDHAAAFDRVARAVRRSILLARALDDPPRPRAAANDDLPGPARTAARKRIIRDVEDAIHREAAGVPGSPVHAAARAAALHRELHDRLDAPDLDDDIRARPVAAIVADLCRDLGLAALPGHNPWKRRTPAAAAALAARAAAPAHAHAPVSPSQVDTRADPQAGPAAACPASPYPSPSPTPWLPPARARGK